MRIVFVRKHEGLLFLLPVLVVLLATTIFPLLYNLYLSVTNYNIYLSGARLTSFVGLANYKALVTEPLYGFADALRVTAVFSGIAVSVELALGLLFAILLNQEFRGRGLVRTLIVLPMLISPVSIGLNWRLMFETESYGLFNFLLMLLGMRPITWLSQPSLALMAVILADIWEWTPLMILIFLAGLQLVPTAPYEAAIVDGAGRWPIFRYVTLPALRQMIVIAVLIRLMDSLNTFTTIYAMTGGGPGTSTSILNFNMFLHAFDYGYISIAASEALILVLIMIVIARLFLRFAG
jgi:multiple sugar transport system permease protein